MVVSNRYRGSRQILADAVSSPQVANPEPSDLYFTICRQLLNSTRRHAISIMIFPVRTLAFRGSAVLASL